MSEEKIMINNCARCGKNHTVIMKSFIDPPDKGEYTHFAICPIIDEPILITVITSIPTCHICGESAEETCQSCGEYTCSNCQVPFTIHRQITECRCINCEDFLCHQ